MRAGAIQGAPGETPITTAAVRAWWPIAASALISIATVVGVYARFDYRLTTLEAAARVDADGRREMLARIRNVEKMLTLIVCTQQGAGAATCREALDATHGGQQ